MSLLSGPGVSNAAAFILLATEGLTDGERDIFLREVLVYAADGLRGIHGNRPAAEVVYCLADQLVAEGAGG